MCDKDLAYIRLMLETLEKIFSYTSGLKSAEEFENDIKSFDATLMNFVVLGEIVSKLSTDIKEKHNNINWNKIYGFRNILAHDYFGILPEEVWEIIIKHLPKLKTDLNLLIS